MTVARAEETRAPAERSRRAPRRGPRRAAGRAFAAGTLVAAVSLAALPALAEWLQPDLSYRETQLALRFATRDTLGHGEDPGRLDSLGTALLKLARLDEANTVFRRSLAAQPGGRTAQAALGKIALFQDRLDDATPLLTAADPTDQGAIQDLMAARVRRGEWAQAAELAPSAQQEGRVELLRRLAERAPYEVVSGPKRGVQPFVRDYPVPLVRTRLNGHSVLMAVDTGAPDLLLDESAFRRIKAQPVAGQGLVFWTGSRMAVKHAIVQRLDIAGYRIENCPAGVLNLGKWSMEVNPQSERIAGVIGLNLLRRFTPRIDYRQNRLELHRLDSDWAPPQSAAHVPFQIWGESELMVYGSMSGSRRMAMVLQTGVPGCGVGAPIEVFDEIGVRPSTFSRLVKGVGQFLQGRPWSAVVVPSVTMGPVVSDRLPGWLGALDSSELWRHGVRRDALLAGDFFKNRRLTIDWRHHQLVVED